MSLYPVYDITRNSIQRSIYELQQKIRKRRQIEFQLQQEIALMNEKLNQQMIYVDHLAKLKNSNQIKYLEPNFGFSKNNQLYSNISPINEIHQKTFKSSIQYDQPLSEDQSELVYKYYNGIKAAEYFKDLQRLQYNKKILDKQNEVNMKRLMSINKQKILQENKEKYSKYSQSIKQYITPQKQQNQKRISYQKDTKKKQKYNLLNNDFIEEGVQTITNTALKHDKNNKQSQKNAFKNKIYQPNKILDLILKQRQFKLEKSESPYKKIKENSLKRQGESSLQKLKKLDQRQLLINKQSLSKRSKKQKRKVYGNTIHVDKINLTFKQNNEESSYNNRNRKGFKSSRARSQQKSKNQKSKLSNINISQDKIYIPAPIFPNHQTIDHQQFFLEKIKNFCQKKIEKRLVLSQVIYKDSKLRNNRHQIGHLIHKFENQLKLRKQIRDKINKNPRILKKHKMVVE